MTGKRKAAQFAEKPCAACGSPFTPTGSRQRVCADCRGTQAAVYASTHANGNGHAPTFDALDVIDAFGLDFNVGNAVRFLLENNDGDVVANLRNAHAYIERAIARHSTTSPALAAQGAP